MKVWSEKGFIPFELLALTPVHIGSGEDFSPLQYVVRQPAPDKYEVWLVDTAGWLARSSARPEVAKALIAGEMEGLRRALNRSPDLENVVLAKIRVSTPQLGKALLAKREAIENKAEIMSFTRNPFTSLPYIPASSIKGAISTALTDYLNEKRKTSGMSTLRQTRTRFEYDKVMQDIYGPIGSHAMQNLKIADTSLPPDSTSIREAIGLDLDPRSGAKAKTPCETLNPSGQWRAFGNMRFASENERIGIQLKGRPSLIEPQELVRICNDFYKKRFLAELKKFYTLPHFQETGKTLAPVLKRIENLDKDSEMLLRIGHYSHIECVTVSGNPLPKGYGKSRTLADRLLPFGWVILKKCSMVEYNQGISAVDATFRKEIEKRANLVRINQQKQKEAEEQAAEKARREAEARELEERLASLSPLERLLWEIAQPNADENIASEIYKRLAEFGDQEKQAAEALMRYWQKAGKWEGKSLSKRQKEKVKVVSAKLGL